MNWTTGGRWQGKLLDSWQETQINLSRQESVQYDTSLAREIDSEKKDSLTGIRTICVLVNHMLVAQYGIVLLVGCLTSQQHASESQGRICSDNFTCCHTEIEVADPTFYLTQSQYTDTGPTSPSADPIMPGAWQGSHWSANF